MATRAGCAAHIPAVTDLHRSKPVSSVALLGDLSSNLSTPCPGAKVNRPHQPQPTVLETGENVYKLQVQECGNVFPGRQVRLTVHSRSPGKLPPFRPRAPAEPHSVVAHSESWRRKPAALPSHAPGERAQRTALLHFPQAHPRHGGLHTLRPEAQRHPTNCLKLCKAPQTACGVSRPTHFADTVTTWWVSMDMGVCISTWCPSLM